ncbi:MAG: Ribosomal protein [Ignavibacteria bacterium]|nr:Ribosomal protein [Ignavibacteria bacterium]
MQVDLYTKEGEVSGQIELNEEIFGKTPNESAMHYAVVSYLAHQRQGTRSTKTRAEVRGGGKKPWRQKGRGTARAGSSRSPLWTGGGTIHGPRPTTFVYKISKKLKQLARISAISLRCSEKNMMVVEDFTFENIKTKQMYEVLKNLSIESEKTLIVIPKQDPNFYFSARNIPNISVYPLDKISTYDILSHKKLFLMKGTVELMQKNINN